ncbi:NPCBM/NEW2 domain-containing protein [Nocardioides sp. MH1]|uniref:NPCBM/NEW2 domain-containing protein n=1 Tax=Nocardioides sp. MH1 TaxID=3242490 RepID=UPI003521D92D
MRSFIAQLVAAAVALAALLVAPAAPAEATPTLTITRAASALVETGDTVSFSGHAPSAAHGVALKLQRKTRKRGRWITVASTRIAASGAWAASGKATGSGTNYWRATYTRNGVATSSKTLSHKVYQWYYLTSYAMVDDSGSSEGSATIGGHRYEYSVHGTCCTADWAEYNVSYRCATLRADIGIDDDSETGMRATFSMSADGARTPLGTRGLGPSARVDVDIQSILRVRLTMEYPSTDYDGYGVFGNPRVLCAGEPA